MHTYTYLLLLCICMYFSGVVDGWTDGQMDVCMTCREVGRPVFRYACR